MLIAGWSLTNACNLSCMHCYNTSGKRSPLELTTEECLTVVDKLARAKVTAVNFGGGECALRSDFIPICEALHNNNIEVSYTTNGTVLDVVKDNVHLFHDIGVSVDFPNQSAHDTFRGKRGTWEKAISAIDYLVSQKVNTELVTCLTKQNALPEVLSAMYTLAKIHKVPYWRLNRFRANGRGKNNENELALSSKDLQKAYTHLSTSLGSSSAIADPLFRAAFGGTYACIGDPSGNTSFRIQIDGEVSPSVFLSASGGNIKNQSLEDIFQSPIFQSIRNREPKGKCQQCSAYQHCQGGDAGASYLAYGHFHGPDPGCWLQPNDKKARAVQTQPRTWNVHELYLCTLYIPIQHQP